jgi:hypothetical protein
MITFCQRGAPGINARADTQRGGTMKEITLEAIEERIALISEESRMYNEGQRDLAEA